MELYSHKPNETIRASSLTYGIVSWFWNKGRKQTCSIEEGKKLDQRAFGPAVARGLIVQDGTIWFLSEAGEQWMQSFLNRTVWKSLPSKDFSHYIKFRSARAKVHMMKRRHA